MEYRVKNGESINIPSLQFGDIVIIESGSFGGVNPQVSGVTYKSEILLGAKTGEWYFSGGVSQVVMDGFDITDNGPLHENGNCDNIMRNCRIHDAYMGWDVTQGSHRNITENCKFERCHYAFHTSGTNNVGNIIRNNEIYDCIDDGINVSPVATGTQIINNIVANSGDNGIHCFGASSVVKGNLVYGSKGVGLWVAGGNSIVENNTIIGIGGTTYNKLFWLEKSGNRVYYNIFYVDDPKEALFFSQGSGDMDYNCWYNPQNPMNRLEFNNMIGLHSVLKDPKFVDIANNDYRLQTDSPCIGWGYIQNGGGKKMWDVIGINFVATFKKGSITGKVSKDGIGLESVWLDLTGEVASTTQTDSNGIFQFLNLPNGVYKVTPKSAIYIFEPVNADISIPTT